MTENEKELKGAVIRFLEDWGFSVQEIERRENRKSADLLATRRQTFLIELKNRGNDLEQIQNERKRLLRGETVPHVDTAGYKNRVSGIIRHGVKQLKAHGDIPHDFRLLWLHSSGRHTNVKMLQFEGTLYGTTNITDLDGDQYHRPCYYFYDSEFFRYRGDLDGAILSTQDQARFCLNTLSPRIAGLRESFMAQHFVGEIIDPDTQENAHEAYIAYTNLNRTKPEQILNYLRKKYGQAKLINIDMGYHSVAISVPTDRADGR